uniref:GRF-type domain-containing protein n=1 Tax=Nicotiana tabacum TaxID=4097 RepID=A0A1S4A0K6_TOBAC|nr:PREDICTED: uncharacterized protein LOC107792400 [Nicotiana tabacum]
MRSTNLARLCMEDDDPGLNEEVRCNHGYVLPIMTVWTPRNPGRRYWVCPYYEDPRSCDFWRWRDVEIDPRSKFVIPKLVEKIGELESALKVYESVMKPRGKNKWKGR